MGGGDGELRSPDARSVYTPFRRHGATAPPPPPPNLHADARPRHHLRRRPDAGTARNASPSSPPTPSSAPTPTSASPKPSARRNSEGFILSLQHGGGGPTVIGGAGIDRGVAVVAWARICTEISPEVRWLCVCRLSDLPFVGSGLRHARTPPLFHSPAFKPPPLYRFQHLQ